MKTVAGQVVLAVVFVVVGLAAWTAGRWEGHVADTREELALLHYGALEADPEDLEGAIGYVGRLPWIADGLLSDVREDRAAAEYWQARYDAVEPQRDASDAEPQRAPALLALSANAAYRAGQQAAGGDRQATLRGLDEALKRYTELLKNDETNADVAYNYEFIVRLRDAMSKARPPSLGRREDPASAARKSEPAGLAMAGDLPEGRTVHGDPGAPPPGADMSQFKMHIPVRPDERQGGSDAGQGKQKVRKG